MLFISDLHEQRPGPKCDFLRCAYWPLIHLIERYPDEPVAVLGDWVDAWQDADVRAIEAVPEYALLHELLAERVKLYVSGNHDCNVKRFCGVEAVRGPVLLEIDTPAGKQKVLAGHGHRSDWANRPGRMWIGRLATRLAGHAEAGIHPDADTWLEGLARRLAGGRHAYGEKLPIWAMREAAKAGADRAVMGHSHHATAHFDYYNCGHWTGPQARHGRNYVRIAGTRFRIIKQGHKTQIHADGHRLKGSDDG